MRTIAFLTKSDRFLPDIEWSNKSYIHNIFRFWEMIFGRKFGAKAEASVEVFYDTDGQINVRRHFFTLEAVLAHVEGTVRDALKVFSPQNLLSPLPQFGYIPRSALATVAIVVMGVEMKLNGDSVFAPMFAGAIAFDTADKKDGAGAGSPITLSFTTTGSSRGLVAGCHQGGGSAPATPAMTYNSVSMTQETTPLFYNQRQVTSFSLIAPATGANTASMSWSGGGSTEAGFGLISYTGVDQTDMVEATNTGAISGTSFNGASVTTLTANAVVATFISFRNGVTTVACSDNQRYVLQQGDSSGSVQMIGGDKQATTTGSYSVAFTASASEAGPSATLAIKPSASTNVTADAGVVTATFSTPAPAISGGANVAQSTPPTATFNTNAPAISGDANVTSSVVTATFSLPAPNIITPDSYIDASVVTATFSLPTPTVEIDTQVDVGVLTATFSLPASSVQIDFTHSANVQTATFTLPAPVISAESNITISASVVTATFSLPSATISAEQNAVAEPSVLTATFSLPVPTVTAVRNVSVDVGVVTATFSTNAPTKVGGLWTAQPRTLGDWTPQPRSI